MRIVRFLLLLCLLLLLTVPVFANTAQMPNVILRVTGAPEDCSVSLESAEGEDFAELGRGYRRVWETTYQHWLRIGEPEDWKNLRFRVSSGGETFEVPIPDEWIVGYSSILSFNWETRELTSGEYPGRYALIAAVRVVCTLLIEGIIFHSWGFRSRRSWIAFVCVNLTTQAFLNWALSGTPDYESYVPILAFFGTEFIILIAESIAFPLLTKEQGRGRTVLYALCANLLSAAAGGWMMLNLPI